MSERDRFLADIIFELNRQKEIDAEAFATSSKKLTDAEVFKKLCYSYPLVNAEDIPSLTVTVDSIAKSQNCVMSKTFCLDETFLDNLSSMSEKQSVTSKSLQSLAAVVFLKFPKYLLSCNRTKLSLLFSNFVHHIEDDYLPNNRRRNMKWFDIVCNFRSLVMRANSSFVSELPAQTFMEGFHLVSLLSSISSLDKLVQLLQSDTDTANSDVDNKELKTASSSHSTDISAVEKEFLAELDDSSDDTLTLDTVLLRLVKEVLTTTSAGGSNSSNSVSAVGGGAERCSLVGGLKEMWLHSVFIYRDVLIRIPSLIQPYLPPLCDLLLSHSTGAAVIGEGNGNSGSGSQSLSSLFDFSKKAQSQKGRQQSVFPSSSECILVMTLANIAAFLADPPSSHNVNGSNSNGGNRSNCENIESVQQLRSARAALRTYLTVKNRVAAVVDICERMSPPPAHSKNSAVVKLIDAESVGFLLDIGSLYSTDLGNGSYTFVSGAISAGQLNPASTPAATHFDGLVTSRAVGSLVGALVSVVRHATAGSAADSKIDSNIATLSSRLVRWFSVLCLHSPAVRSYLLASTDFTDALTQLRAEGWSSFNSSASSLVSSGLFAPEDAVALLTVLLLTCTANSPTNSAATLLHALLSQALKLVRSDIVVGHTDATKCSNNNSMSRISANNISTMSSEVAVPHNDSDVSAVDKILSALNGVAVDCEEGSGAEQQEHEEVNEKQSAKTADVLSYRAITAAMTRLTSSLTLLASETGGATLLRDLFAHKTGTGMPHDEVLVGTQNLLRETVGDFSRLASSQLGFFAALESAQPSQPPVCIKAADDDRDERETPIVDSSGPTNSPTLDVNVTNIRAAHEALKKQLKVVQSLMEGFRSSKAD